MALVFAARRQTSWVFFRIRRTTALSLDFFHLHNTQTFASRSVHTTAGDSSLLLNPNRREHEAQQPICETTHRGCETILQSQKFFDAAILRHIFFHSDTLGVCTGLRREREKKTHVAFCDESLPARSVFRQGRLDHRIAGPDP